MFVGTFLSLDSPTSVGSAAANCVKQKLMRDEGLSAAMEMAVGWPFLFAFSSLYKCSITTSALNGLFYSTLQGGK
jgi:hypothetical protein